jgi:UDP-N-acetylmuramate--alanine ligase
MIDILNFNNFYLVGIKGVAMTSMAQLLIDANKKVAGSDVEEKFVTQEILDKMGVKIDTDFTEALPADVDCVIYTAAHQALENPQVKQALTKNIPVVSQAEAVASLFNQQAGIAVCGVGGKSTVSAMISWVLNDLKHDFSFSVGVGNIPGINKTGQWNPKAKYFAIEADEYVIDPQSGFDALPRFSFLKPLLTICTNLKFDHPDVYRDFDHTKQTYNDFFRQIKPNGKLIVNSNDLQYLDDNLPMPKLTFGEDTQATLSLTSYQSQLGQTLSKFSYKNKIYDLKLQLPGKFNVINALATILALTQLEIDPQQAADSLATFASTKRRFEFIGKKNEISYYDDYAHHPHEVKAAIAALADWYPVQRKVIAFQSHTYSRTKELFDEFVAAFADADEVVMIDIFSSAREKADLSVSSDRLCEVINKRYQLPTKNLKNIDNLAEYCKNNLNPGDVLITLGAGDIYQVHNLV